MIQPVHPKRNQSRIFIGRTDAEAEAPILWPPGVKSWLTGKDADAEKDWRQEEKGTTEDEMAGWHHWLSGHEFEWIPGVGDGQGGLVCCSLWGHKELCTTEWLNWTASESPGELSQICISGSTGGLIHRSLWTFARSIEFLTSTQVMHCHRPHFTEVIKFILKWVFDFVLRTPEVLNTYIHERKNSQLLGKLIPQLLALAA